MSRVSTMLKSDRLVFERCFPAETMTDRRLVAIFYHFIDCYQKTFFNSKQTVQILTNKGIHSCACACLCASIEGPGLTHMGVEGVGGGEGTLLFSY